jgi:O-antigen/teichoic acid export membrane protein
MSFAKKSYSLFQRDVLLFLTNIITGIIIARKLGPDMRGLYAILLLIPGYAEAFGRLKFDVAAVYFLGKKKAGMGEIVFLLNMLAILTSTIIISLFLWQYDWIYAQLYQNTTVDMHLLSFTVLGIIPLQFVSTNYAYILIYREDVKTYNRMVVLNALVGSVLGILLLVVLDWGIWGVLLGSIIGFLISIIYGFIKVSKIEKMVPFFKPILIWQLAKYGFQHYLAGIIGHLHVYLTNLLSALYLVPAQVAFFSMAKGQGEKLTRMVPGAINTLLFPKISKSDDDQYNSEITLRSFRITLLILILSGILLSIVIKPLVYILYGEDYLPMALPFWIMLPGFVLFQSASVFSSYFGGIGRPDLIPKITILPLIIQSILAFLLMPSLEVTGAAIAFLMSSISVTIISMLVFYKMTSSNISDFVINKTDLNILIKFIKDNLKFK